MELESFKEPVETVVAVTGGQRRDQTVCDGYMRQNTGGCTYETREVCLRMSVAGKSDGRTVTHRGYPPHHLVRHTPAASFSSGGLADCTGAIARPDATRSRVALGRATEGGGQRVSQ